MSFAQSQTRLIPLPPMLLALGVLASCEFEVPGPLEHSLTIEVLGGAAQPASEEFGVRVGIEPRGGDQLRLWVVGGQLRVGEAELQPDACLELADPNVPLHVFVVPEQLEALLWAELYDSEGEAEACPVGALRAQTVLVVSRAVDPGNEGDGDGGDGDGDAEGDGDGDGDGDGSTT